MAIFYFITFVNFIPRVKIILFYYKIAFYTSTIEYSMWNKSKARWKRFVLHTADLGEGGAEGQHHSLQW
jgi:hypothetical protein